jgi:hypothetical protein
MPALPTRTEELAELLAEVVNMSTNYARVALAAGPGGYDATALVEMSRVAMAASDYVETRSEAFQRHYDRALVPTMTLGELRVMQASSNQSGGTT